MGPQHKLNLHGKEHKSVKSYFYDCILQTERDFAKDMEYGRDPDIPWCLRGSEFKQIKKNIIGIGKIF